ncbi:methyltransferase domain-containing protein [Nostocoides sp. F2B08]|uniref:methyltransferase domain-containing protein n=1 Tax=Nostocoides sp. F2B08 TaxID=2653936 RepID=UPI0012632C9B|nr:methyltransferase domain-containing protein [Tetrasphaera sp. F2B08]KAB7742437.1 methyltransferase domain-containing protein [Tetrasphaera sp. F2B08]
MTDLPSSRPTGHPAATNLRTAAIWESVHALAAARERELGRPLVILDLGGGTGGLAVPLALAGHHVHVIDPSPDALASLQRRASEQGLGEDGGGGGSVTAVQGDADTITDTAAVSDLVGGRPIDLICCHDALEMVDDPAATIRAMAAILTPGGALSLVTAGRLAAVLHRVLAGRFTQAQRALTSRDGRWGDADPMPRRFDTEALTDLLISAGFAIEDVHGVRIFSDLVPSAYIDTEADRRALLELEAAAATHPDHPLLGQLGAATHIVARRRS